MFLWVKWLLPLCILGDSVCCLTGTAFRPAMMHSGALAFPAGFGIACPAVLHRRAGCEEPADALQYPKEENFSRRITIIFSTNYDGYA
jgi:hypothetical protein